MTGDDAKLPVARGTAFCRQCRRTTPSIPHPECGGPACVLCGRCPDCGGDLPGEGQSRVDGPI